MNSETPPLEAVANIEEQMKAIVAELDRLGLPMTAVRLQHALDTLHDELAEITGIAINPYLEDEPPSMH